MPSEPPWPEPDGPARAWPPVSDAGFSAPRSLHPASIVLGVPLRQLIQGLVFPALIGAGAGPGPRFAVVVVAVILLVGGIGRLLAWQRFRFSFDGEVLRVDEGVLSRNHRALDVARIQQVEVDRSLVARVLGLATLRVETAGGSGEAEVELRVIPERDAVTLREALRAGKDAVTGAAAATPGGAVSGVGTADTTEPRDGREVVSMTLGRIVLAAVSGSRLLVLPAVLAASLQFLGDASELGGGSLDPETLGRRILALGIVGIIVLLIPASVVSATAVGVLRDWDWTMRRVGDDLHVSRGLLSTRDSVIPLARVQLVEVQRNWVRRGFGYAAIRVHSAGGGDDDRVTIPLVRDTEVDGLISQLLPGVAGVPMLRSHPTGARRRAVFRWVRASLVPTIALLAFPGLVGELRALGIVLPLIAAGLGLVEYGQLAHGRTDRVLAGRSGALSVTTGLAPLVKVQGVTRRASPFQRRLGLATLTAHVAGPGGDLTVLDLGEDAGRQLHAELVVAAADPYLPDIVSRQRRTVTPGQLW
ncbi:MAG: PH domain-containing protein [Nitriliruptor sp.]|uniref:PH domain-containing protein n=1 Tax=Nitriliruptor sp. TaxID=2448056 RepID=UPI0034A00288